MDLVKSLSGKVCQHSDTYFAMRNGTRYTGKISEYRCAYRESNRPAKSFCTGSCRR